MHLSNELADLLERWEDGGCVQSAEELAKDNPELLEDLQDAIKLLKKTAWLDKPEPQACACDHTRIMRIEDANKRCSFCRSRSFLRRRFEQRQ